MQHFSDGHTSNSGASEDLCSSDQYCYYYASTADVGNIDEKVLQSSAQQELESPPNKLISCAIPGAIEVRCYLYSS